MRKFTSFAFGLLLGTVMATGWVYVPTSSNSGLSAASASMNPFEMMSRTSNLPVQGDVDAY